MSFAQASPASTSGTRVVLPAPGGATSTAKSWVASAAVSSGSTSSIHAGWTLLRAKYDDGGFSGGNTDRPALQRLLEDVLSKTGTEPLDHNLPDREPLARS